MLNNMTKNARATRFNARIKLRTTVKKSVEMAMTNANVPITPKRSLKRLMAPHSIFSLKTQRAVFKHSLIVTKPRNT